MITDKEIAVSYKAVKQASKVYGAGSQQYEDAMASHAALVIKYMQQS